MKKQIGIVLFCLSFLLSLESYAEQKSDFLDYCDDFSKDYEIKTNNIEYNELSSVRANPTSFISVSNLKYFHDGTQIIQTPQVYGKNAAITGILHNTYHSELFLEISVATYDDNGRLLAVSQRNDLHFAPQSDTIFSVCVKQAEKLGSKLKLFFWENGKPLCNAAVDVSYNIDDFPQTSGTMIDNFKDFSKMYDYDGFRLENCDPIKMPGFEHSMIRVYDLYQSCKYYVPGAKSVIIDAFVLSKQGDISILAGKYDGKYVKVIASKGELTYTSGGWYAIRYTAENLPKNTDFIKIEIPQNYFSAYTPLITKVSIKY